MIVMDGAHFEEGRDSRSILGIAGSLCPRKIQFGVSMEVNDILSVLDNIPQLSVARAMILWI